MTLRWAPCHVTDPADVRPGTLSTPASHTPHILTSYFLATGSDGFQVLFSLAELDPGLGAPQGLVAHDIDHTGSLGSSGFARIVIPGDLHGGRFVSNLARLEVVNVPEPPTLALLILGLVSIWRLAPRPGRRASREVAHRLDLGVVARPDRARPTSEA